MKGSSKTCVKRPLKNKQNKDFMTSGSLMKVESIAECSPRSILQSFGLDLAIISLMWYLGSGVVLHCIDS